MAGACGAAHRPSNYEHTKMLVYVDLIGRRCRRGHGSPGVAVHGATFRPLSAVKPRSTPYHVAGLDLVRCQGLSPADRSMAASWGSADVHITLAQRSSVGSTEASNGRLARVGVVGRM